MRSAHPFKIVTASLAMALLSAASALAQSPPPGDPAAPSAPPKPGTPAPSGQPTLLPEAGDPSNVDEVVLGAKPALIVSGTSDWESGLKNIRASIGKIEAELGRLGLAPAGRPLVLYTQTTDEEFKFDAMIPIGPVPTPPPTGLPEGLRLGETPSGKAYRFVHKGPYDDIDNTYTTITAYLEAKDIVARDAFMEEFANDVTESTDGNLEVNIFVQPK